LSGCRELFFCGTFQYFYCYSTILAATKAAIAPPSFLTESSDSKPKNSVGSDFQFAKDLKGSVAHKIMSKYGFKEGKGLGKDNRGMSHALQVKLPLFFAHKVC